MLLVMWQTVHMRFIDLYEVIVCHDDYCNLYRVGDYSVVRHNRDLNTSTKHPVVIPLPT